MHVVGPAYLSTQSLAITLPRVASEYGSVGFLSLQLYILSLGDTACVRWLASLAAVICITGWYREYNMLYIWNDTTR